MGQMISRDSIEDGTWYFSDAYYNPDIRGYTYDWPSSDYPHRVFIHDDELKYSSNNTNKIRIREWIERFAASTVIYDKFDCSYTKYYKAQHGYQYKVPNVWVGFHFNNSEDATMFLLAFADMAKPVTLHHPNRPEDEEWCNMTYDEKEEAYRQGNI